MPACSYVWERLVIEVVLTNNLYLLSTCICILSIAGLNACLYATAGLATHLCLARIIHTYARKGAFV